jgi:primosomal protein N'
MIVQASVNECDVCGHRWLSETVKVPTRCAKCKSSKWNASGPGATDQGQKLGDEDHEMHIGYSDQLQLFSL